ncbi:YkuS family protein [Bacillus atrophaeus]|uniref:YkuS family protein n=1 Tax=Bacillus atrophaeus TaxID=1452 RepID=UPI002E23CBCE|nr:YkuS family protein [Bacillus atrophaeus]MED4804807.1 YkuS family protein [Bacillus atrophaeus]MED4816935.1 YkuS family protein [Bacillus atrophaeus]MED4819942.1 YkuS family protein [Bacillus atrophaeus]MED4823860.1 YkuS family protein [Bacillus atrophaeus]
MTKKIGIEQSLTDVEAALKEKGYDVVMMKTPEDAAGCDCCVVTGLDSNVQGIADTSIQASVITASGMTADEICSEVEKKFH